MHIIVSAKYRGKVGDKPIMADRVAPKKEGFRRPPSAKKNKSRGENQLVGGQN
jgi:hypothetical protein